MIFEIKSRWSDRIVASGEAESLRDLVIKKVAERAVLSGADLRGAVLSGADLRGADLRDADLRGADLRDAVLRGAVLRGADLRGAVLRGADLRGADLRDAVLSGADLSGAQRQIATDGGAMFDGEVDYEKLRDEFRARRPDVPIVPALDKQICEIVSTGQGQLDMGAWHRCETTHCRAGWAIHLAGDAGRELELKYGSERAGGFIYRASTGRWPNFFADNDVALKDICEWGAKDSGPAEVA
jgi:hypothetical protein